MTADGREEERGAGNGGSPVAALAVSRARFGADRVVRRGPGVGRKEGRSLQFEVPVDRHFFQIERLFLDGIAFRPARAVIFGFDFPILFFGFETRPVPSGPCEGETMTPMDATIRASRRALVLAGLVFP